MRTLDLAAGFVVLLLAFKGLHLGFRQHNPFLCGFFLQHGQSLLERFQPVPQPNGANSRGGNKYSSLAKFIAGADLPVSGVVRGKADNGFFCHLIHTVL